MQIHELKHTCVCQLSCVSDEMSALNYLRHQIHQPPQKNNNKESCQVPQTHFIK